MHTTQIVHATHWRGGDRWRARCECGWAGNWQTVMVRAEMDAQHHERTATHPAAPVACTCEYPYPAEVWQGHHPNCEVSTRG